MKQCPNCGADYPDTTERCAIDNEFLLDKEILGGPMLPPTLPPPLPLSPTEAQSGSIPLISADERRMRWIELGLVCLIAFGGDFLSSTRHFIYSFITTTDSGAYIASYVGNYSWFRVIAQQSVSLGLLWYVLARRGQRFSDLGWRWRLQDIGPSILLKVGGTAAYYSVFLMTKGVFDTAAQLDLIPALPQEDITYTLFGNKVVVLAMLAQFINPFFEELIVRAYLMTEVKALTHNVRLAIILSTVLQTSYHFYQGVPSAMGVGAMFLISSIYYAKTNRITPIILAHFYSDILATMHYAANH